MASWKINGIRRYPLSTKKVINEILVSQNVLLFNLILFLYLSTFKKSNLSNSNFKNPEISFANLISGIFKSFFVNHQSKGFKLHKQKISKKFHRNFKSKCQFLTSIRYAFLSHCLSVKKIFNSWHSKWSCLVSRFFPRASIPKHPKNFSVSPAIACSIFKINLWIVDQKLHQVETNICPSNLWSKIKKRPKNHFSKHLFQQ